MWGYEITAKNRTLNYEKVYKGWREGALPFESAAKEAATKKIAKKVLTHIVGGSAGTAIKVAKIISKPLQGFGETAGKFIAEVIGNLNRNTMNTHLMYVDIIVTIEGDFDAKYLIEDLDDFLGLPALLSLIPEKNNRKNFMGENVLVDAYRAHRDFIRFASNRTGKYGNQTQYNLCIKIET